MLSNSMPPDPHLSASLTAGTLAKLRVSQVRSLLHFISEKLQEFPAELMTRRLELGALFTLKPQELGLPSTLWER